MMNGINNLREFGEFVLDTEKRVLWFENDPVNLQLKEIELLCVLTEQSGEVVTKQTLLDRVWADSFVEESNLSRHVYRIRKTFKELGASDDLIQTVPRRGYRFTGSVNESRNDDLIIERHLISRTLFEEVEDQAKPSLESISAELMLKKRPQTVGLVLFLAAILGTVASFYLYNRNVKPVLAQPINSVAVLPLRTTNSRDENVLRFGFSDALITSLGKLDDLHVISANAVSRYAETTDDPIVIAKELGVDAVMDGTLQKANGKFRVTLRLLRAADGKQIWAGVFDEAESRIFELQDEMARQTAQILVKSFKTGEAVERPTTNLEAYNLFLQGEYFFRRREISKAGAYFKKAIELDSQFAEAWAGLASVYAMGDAMGEAEPTVNKALELKPNLAQAHAVHGFIKYVSGMELV